MPPLRLDSLGVTSWTAAMKPNNVSKKSGPKPERVKIDKDWEDAVGDALKKKRPAEGWPKQGKEKEKGKEK